MPTFAELVEEDLKPKPTEQRRTLFESLVGDPAIVYQDALEHPSKYRPEDMLLLEELMKGRKLEELSDAEKKQLDRTVFDFESIAKPPAKPKLPSQKRLLQKDEPPVLARPGVDVPETELPPFWWL